MICAGHDFGAGMLTYSGTECESETFLGFVEFAPASELVSRWTMQPRDLCEPEYVTSREFVAVGQDQCVDAFYDDIPEIVNDMYMFVDGQIWQCTDDDGIGYDLSNQPTHAQYDKNCKNGLRTIAYLREQECFMHDDSYDPLDRSYSLTCKKSKSLALHAEFVSEFDSVAHLPLQSCVLRTTTTRRAPTLTGTTRRTRKCALTGPT